MSIINKENRKKLSCYHVKKKKKFAKTKSMSKGDYSDI